MSLIQAERLQVEVGGRMILRDVDFQISEGEIVTIIGPNGSGKSTLLRALIGAINASGGSIKRKDGLRMGYVPQRLGLERALPLTVARFLSLPTRLSVAETARLLARTGAEGLASQQMTALSGGQFQRVLLARALAGDPQILILDEPTQGLDQPAIASFYKLIEKLRQEIRCAVLMVSHELHVVMRASDRVICLNGHVCCEGAPMAVSAAPEYRALFGDSGATLALYKHVHDHSHDHDHEHRPVGADG
ncbi:MAG: metal ABC transporter ATP-binding protein [Pseudomonadota bacterium]